MKKRILSLGFFLLISSVVGSINKIHYEKSNNFLNVKKFSNYKSTEKKQVDNIYTFNFHKKSNNKKKFANKPIKKHYSSNDISISSVAPNLGDGLSVTAKNDGESNNEGVNNSSNVSPVAIVFLSIVAVGIVAGFFAAITKFSFGMLKNKFGRGGEGASALRDFSKRGARNNKFGRPLEQGEVFREREIRKNDIDLQDIVTHAKNESLLEVATDKSVVENPSSEQENIHITVASSNKLISEGATPYFTDDTEKAKPKMEETSATEFSDKEKNNPLPKEIVPDYDDEVRSKPKYHVGDKKVLDWHDPDGKISDISSSSYIECLRYESSKQPSEVQLINAVLGTYIKLFLELEYKKVSPIMFLCEDETVMETVERIYKARVDLLERDFYDKLIFDRDDTFEDWTYPDILDNDLYEYTESSLAKNERICGLKIRIRELTTEQNFAFNELVRIIKNAEPPKELVKEYNDAISSFNKKINKISEKLDTVAEIRATRKDLINQLYMQLNSKAKLNIELRKVAEQAQDVRFKGDLLANWKFDNVLERIKVINTDIENTKFQIDTNNEEILRTSNEISFLKREVWNEGNVLYNLFGNMEIDNPSLFKSIANKKNFFFDPINNREIMVDIHTFQWKIAETINDKIKKLQSASIKLSGCVYEQLTSSEHFERIFRNKGSRNQLEKTTFQMFYESTSQTIDALSLAKDKLIELMNNFHEKLHIVFNYVEYSKEEFISFLESNLKDKISHFQRLEKIIEFDLLVIDNIRYSDLHAELEFLKSLQEEMSEDLDNMKGMLINSEDENGEKLCLLANQLNHGYFNGCFSWQFCVCSFLNSEITSNYLIPKM